MAYTPAVQHCTNCSIGNDVKDGQWWHLGRYYGISGTFCPSCYDKVSHDPYGVPKHLQAYAEILAEQQLKP